MCMVIMLCENRYTYLSESRAKRGFSSYENLKTVSPRIAHFIYPFNRKKLGVRTLSSRKRRPFSDKDRIFLTLTVSPKTL